MKRHYRHTLLGVLLIVAVCLALPLPSALAESTPLPAAPTAVPDAASATQRSLAFLALQQQLFAPDGAKDDILGYAVALSGDTALVGAPYNNVYGNSEQGSVCVFTRSGSTWTFQQHLLAPDGAEGDEFGSSVALSGDTALVGAPGGYVDGNGAVCVFTRSGSTWTFQQQLLAPAGAAGDYFGSAVALSGDTALVGASGDEVAGKDNQGSACVFTRSGATWTFEQQLLAPDGTAEDGFGYAVALSGDTALVGAPNDTVDGHSEQGSACVFTRSGATWTFEQQLLAPDGAGDDWFGRAVALSGDTALVGVPRDRVDGSYDQGSACVFTRSGATWTFEQQLLASGGGEDDWFGISVALSGETALVGAHHDTVDGNFRQGSAGVFTRSGATWTFQQQLLAPDGAEGDRFGVSVALSGDTALVGALYDDVDGNSDQGSASVFGPLDVDDTAQPTPVALADVETHPDQWTTIRYRIDDPQPSCGVAEVRIEIKRTDGSVAWSKDLRGMPTNQQLSYDFVCLLPAGNYRYSLSCSDGAGNAGTGIASRDFLVRPLDTKRPTPVARNTVKVRRGQTATIRYRVNDPLPSCGKATVTLTIKRTNGSQVWRKRLTNVSTNSNHSYSFRCSLPSGTYRYSVSCTDAAGHTGTTTASKSFRVY